MNNHQHSKKTVFPPKSWSDPEKQFTEAIENSWYKTIFLLTSSIFDSTINFFRSENFHPALAPITTEAISSPTGIGSDSMPVKVVLFDKETYMADSMQFHLEYVLRHDTKGVFYIMPTFRGEDPDSRHLNQFFHSEAEMIGGLQDVMILVERYIYCCVFDIIEKHSNLVANIAGTTKHLDTFVHSGIKNIPMLTFKECTKLLGDHSGYYNFIDGKPVRLTNQGEKILMQKCGEFVWVTHFPRLGVPFYQATKLDEDVSLCADLLCGIGETVGAGQRNFSYEETLKELGDREVPSENYDWYLRMKKDYPLQTSGFGMGIERLLLWVLNHDDIRDIPIMVRMKGINSAP